MPSGAGSNRAAWRFAIEPRSVEEDRNQPGVRRAAGRVACLFREHDAPVIRTGGEGVWLRTVLTTPSLLERQIPAGVTCLAAGQTPCARPTCGRITLVQRSLITRRRTMTGMAECVLHITEGDGVPLGIPRFAKIVTVIGLASAPVALVCMPALAVSVQQREWWLGALHVTQAWQMNHGTGVTVAVLADGVAASQSDVVGSVVSGPDFTGSPRHAGGPHFGIVGTGLASLIAGHGHGKNGASGVFGVAPGVKILSVRVTLSPGDPLWSDGKFTSGLPDAIARGIRYAVRHGATVIDLPADPAMAGSAGQGSASAGGSSAERAAVAYAIRENVLLVAPAGDNARTGDAANYPAAYPRVISVGAFNQTFVKAPYSSRQPYVTLTAAGQGIVAAAPAGYQMMNSTWAASAIVAGVAALVRSEFPNLTVGQVSHALTSGTKYQIGRALC